MKLIELLNIAKEELAGFTPLQEPDFRLEQAEYNSKDKVWEVVVSFLVPNTNKKVVSNSIMNLATEYQYQRLYKKLKIDSNKSVRSMHMFNAKE